MSEIERLNRDIECLTQNELASFRAWFMTFDAAEWDETFTRHASAGGLDSLADAAIAEHREGHSRLL